MITVSRRIAATPSQLWQPVSDVQRWPELIPTVDDVESVGRAAPTGKGSRFRLGIESHGPLALAIRVLAGAAPSVLSQEHR